MTTLYRKVLRDASRQKGQVIAVTTVVAAGIAMWVTMRGAYESLVESRNSYYIAYRFADVFALVKRAPEFERIRLASIEGVTEVETRLVYEITLDVPGLPEPASGRLLSIPDEGEPALNRIHLRRGRLPEPGRSREIVVSEAFAEANGLSPGEPLAGVLNGRWTQFQITGVAISPEYVYELRGAAVFPDNRRFGVMWMRRDALAAAFRMEGAFNDISLRLGPGAREKDAIDAVDRVLEKYGCTGAYGRSDQLSHRFLSDEIKQDRVTGIIVPAVFLAIAAFLTNAVLTRMVTRQRDQIATLKAFGYANSAIGFHYFLFAMIPVSLGAILGTGIGIWLGQGLAELYQRFFRFPSLDFQLSPAILLGALAVSVSSALVGALAAVRSVVALQPAQAMREEGPGLYHRGLSDWTGVGALLPLWARMILRSMERRPVKSAFTVAGLGMAIAVLLVSRYFTDSLDYLMRVQFELVQRDNATAVFQEPKPLAARYELGRMPGVLRVEPFRVVPVRLRREHRVYRLALQGIAPGSEMRTLLDADLREVPLPRAGVVLTRTLARILHVREGDWLTVEVLEGERAVRQLEVSALVDELIGLAAYMDLDALNRFLQEGHAISGAYLRVDPAQAETLYRRLKRTPAVSSVAVREAMIASFQKTIAENMQVSVTILAVFAAVIAFSIVYNSARIALSERAHELASLRVLGFTKPEVAIVLIGEQLALTIAAIPAGFSMGRALCEMFARAMESELYRFPVVLTQDSYLYSLVILLLASMFSAALALRGVLRLDLLRALKTRE
ncbi:MAG: FtsX-like permease family protein [Bryobacterales bacterium]|nr:FtsX-like permease family protein [Bryobacterales bacterium]